ncbi:hypothetical protein [Fluviicola sp.]|uniref:hypothetical protein n=1 Tax=Fluviicola sp. TaxID=1917219 RepID=UPI0026165DD0|nr:hypothetical protein [Fluviicola sp.]
MLHLKTILLCLFGAIAFGIVHDMITANSCVEYFTIAHPKVIESENPFMLALVWGILATWWVGLILGILIVAFNTIGKSNTIPFSIIRRYVIRLLLMMILTSSLAGLIGYVLAVSGVIHFNGELSRVIPINKQLAFLAVAWAHLSSYIVGFTGGIVICMKVWMQRTNPARKVKKNTL